MARYNPFEELSEIFDRMSRQFDETTDTWQSEFGDWSLTGRTPSLDLVEHDDEFRVTVDLPGYTKSDVDVRVTDHTLHIEAERSEEAEESNDHYLRRERSHRQVGRQIHLPESVDADAVEATMKNGVLTITVPKAEPATQGHAIEIE
ncbi:Hsp20/alpha crystallin family protein [Halorarius halobius]|uniref:Hsp20/alpha crystallin family protein n=1 Tax=Halorarius halobius TaxID=2962671 RepID=UPI0020CF8630|nr:Hsp20/alpha crystallin family protein [Halorarius halobius]